METVELKILIRLADGKQQEFTLHGEILNPDIKIDQIVFDIERAINEQTRYRAHTNIVR